MTELPANPEALLAETAWLRRMAGELARDPSGADDLSQETMLAALGQPAPTRASMRTWLESIARRLNARSYRTRYRREQREQRAAKPEAVHSAAQVFDQFTLHRDVVQAVMELKEPVRSTVLMRFWEGLPPRKIASRLEHGTEHQVTGLKPGRYHFRVLDIANRPLADDKVFGTTRPHDSTLRLGPRAARVEARRPGISELSGSAEVGERELLFSPVASHR